MLFTLDALAELLSTQYKITNVNIQTRSQIRYDIPVLYKGNEKFKSRTLYVVNSYELPENPWLEPGAGIICIGELPPGYNRTRCSAISIKSEDTITEIYSTIVAIYYQHSQFETGIARLAMLQEEDYLHSIVIGTSAIMNGNAIYICDSKGGIIDFEDSSLNTNNLHSNPQFSIENATCNLQNSAVIKESRLPVPIVFTINEHEYNGIIQGIYHDNKLLGSIMTVESVAPVRKRDAYILETVTSSLEWVLFKNYSDVSSQIKSVRNVFIELLNGHPITEEEAQWRLEKHGLEPGSRFFCACVMVSDSTQDNLFTILRRRLPSYVPNAYVVYKDSFSVVFVSTGKDHKTKEEASELLKPLLSDCGYIVGVSNSFTKVSDAAYYFKQGKIAATIGKIHEKQNEFIFFEDCVLDYILDQARTELPTTHICHDGIVELYELDRTTGSEYIKTLRTYFYNNLNGTQTAKDLFIHRSSFLYRLDHIKKILQCDLEDYRTQLYIMISLEMLKSD